MCFSQKIKFLFKVDKQHLFIVSFFLFKVIPDSHENEPEVKHNGKRPWEAEVDSVNPFEILDEDHGKSKDK